MWSSNHFVIYYGSAQVPQPGVIILGKVTGDVAVFDRPGSVKVRMNQRHKTDQKDPVSHMSTQI